MTTDYAEIAQTAARGYAAWLSTVAEVGAKGLGAGAADTARVAQAAATALRTPAAQRGSAVEQALLVAYDAQARNLHRMRGMTALSGMSFLYHFDAARQARDHR